MKNRHFSVSADNSPANTDSKDEIINIVATTDLHSHLNSFITNKDGKNTELGGLSRIKTVIDKLGDNTLVFDSGDFSMGTLFQTMYRREAFELRSLGLIGCSATTIGNHEFDYGTEGIISMLKSANNSGDTLPEIVLCNINRAKMEEKGLSEEQQSLLDAFDRFNIKKYTVIYHNGLKIAVTGVFGKNAFSCAPSCCLIFSSPISALKETVHEIKTNENPDMIICLSHCGTNEKHRKSEDEHIAKAVPDIDLILSGHSHIRIDEPIIHGNTVIISPGEYGKYAGIIKMQRNHSKRWTLDGYKLVLIDNSIVQNKFVQDKIDGYMEKVNQNYLAMFECSSKEILAKNNIDFSTQKDLENKHTENNLGNLISDAYRYAAEKALGEKIDVAIVPSGVIRDTYPKGSITVENVFNSLSLGKGPDDISGNPLIHVYITQKELMFMMEIDASISDYIKTSRFYMSGLHFKYNPHRVLMNKIFEIYFVDNNNNHYAVDDSRMFSAVLDLYTWNMFNSAQYRVKGIMKVQPKNRIGDKYKNINDSIIYYKGHELKAWNAVTKYMRSFPADNDGIPVIPDYYATLHGRKIRCEDISFSAIFSHLNKYARVLIKFFSTLGIIAIIIVIQIIKFIFFIF